MAEPARSASWWSTTPPWCGATIATRWSAPASTVDEALNGLEALEKLLVAPADLLIVDVNMPQMDGLTFLKALRRQAAPSPRLPPLVISTEAGSQDAAAARAAGANFYLVKPVGQEALVELRGSIMCGLPA